MTSTPDTSTGHPIPPVKFAHIVLRTPRYDESVQWWKDFLGAYAQFESDFLTFLTYDEEHHRLAIVNVPNASEGDKNAAGVDHFAFTHAGLEELLATYRRLKEEGVVPYWCINHGPTTSLYYRDPDKNQVELQVDNFPTAEECAEWFHSKAFRENPIGVEFDADVLVEKHLAGIPAAELLTQGSAPRP